MNKKTIGILIGLALPFNVTASRSPYSPQPTGDAPKEGMQSGRWSSANKDAFGTAFEDYDSGFHYSKSSPTAPISRVWFTAAQGILTECYWPTVDTPQIRDSQFLVTDGISFFSEERHDTLSKTEWLDIGVPAFKITNRDKQNRFIIERTLFTDPDRDVILQHIRITKKRPGLKFYLLHNPQVGNTPMGNSAWVSLDKAPALAYMHGKMIKHRPLFFRFK